MFTPTRIDPPHHGPGASASQTDNLAAAAAETAIVAKAENLLAAAGLSSAHWSGQFQRQTQQLTDELLRRQTDLWRQQALINAQTASLESEQRKWELRWQEREHELAEREAANRERRSEKRAA